MTPTHIVLVEDEKDLSNIVRLHLENDGHQITTFADGSEALEFIQKSPNDRPNTGAVNLYILDRMLPGTNGLEICKFLRLYKDTKATPVLMLTAMTRPEQIVEGLDAGADDYVTKPFDTVILMARVRSLLRRAEQLKRVSTERKDESNTLTQGPLKIDTNQCKAWSHDRELDLTLSEYKLLVAFLQEPGKVLTRNQLVEFIQEGPVHVTDRTIDTHIFGLRKKLKENASLIETIRGIGYRVASKID